MLPLSFFLLCPHRGDSRASLWANPIAFVSLWDVQIRARPPPFSEEGVCSERGGGASSRFRPDSVKLYHKKSLCPRRGSHLERESSKWPRLSKHWGPRGLQAAHCILPYPVLCWGEDPKHRLLSEVILGGTLLPHSLEISLSHQVRTVQSLGRSSTGAGT